MPLQDNPWVRETRAARDHREFVGPNNEYDLTAARQFNLLTFLGLREFHTLLDIGCGSLRGGRLFIPYLLAGNYFGIEPEKWLVESGINKEIGRDLVELKRPSFIHNSDFACDVFNQSFDYILAQGVFVHAPESEIRKCISEVSKCMKATSIFVVTYMQGDENYKGSEWRYPETTAYTPNRIAEMALAANLVCIPISLPHPRGAKWILLCSSENENNVLSLADKVGEFHFPEELDDVQTRLTKAEQALSRLRAHPYVKIGFMINRFLYRMFPFK